MQCPHCGSDLTGDDIYVSETNGGRPHTIEIRGGTTCFIITSEAFETAHMCAVCLKCNTVLPTPDMAILVADESNGE